MFWFDMICQVWMRFLSVTTSIAWIQAFQFWSKKRPHLLVKNRNCKIKGTKNRLASILRPVYNAKNKKCSYLASLQLKGMQIVRGQSCWSKKIAVYTNCRHRQIFFGPLTFTSGSFATPWASRISFEIPKNL